MLNALAGIPSRIRRAMRQQRLTVCFGMRHGLVVLHVKLMLIIVQDRFDDAKRTLLIQRQYHLNSGDVLIMDRDFPAAWIFTLLQQCQLYSQLPENATVPLAHFTRASRPSEELIALYAGTLGRMHPDRKVPHSKSLIGPKPGRPYR